MKIFIYRPDRANKVNPDLCYTPKGQPYRDWQRDQDVAYDYKVELIKRKLEQLPKHKIEDYWR